MERKGRNSPNLLKGGKKERLKELEKKYEKLIQKWEKEQHEMFKRLIFGNDFVVEEVRYIGGVDISFGDNNFAVAALVVIDIKDESLKVVYEDYLELTLTIPYIPSFLAFREMEPILTLLKKLRENKPELYPEIIMVDGNGILHPRKLGVASHLGIMSDTPCIGVAKTFLDVGGWNQGDIEILKRDYLKKEGDFNYIVGKNDGFCYGAAYRGKSSDEPLYISIGHKISLKTAMHFVSLTSLVRIPQPVREADLRSRKIIKKKRQEKSQKKRRRKVRNNDGRNWNENNGGKKRNVGRRHKKYGGKKN